MDLDALYRHGTLAVFVLAGVAFPALFWITVPYGGRHTSERWGPTIPARWAWILMELPAPVCIVVAYERGQNAGEPVSLLLLAAFLAHYLNRAVLYPLRMRVDGKRTPLVSATFAFAFNLMNGTLQGLALGQVCTYGVGWLADPRFIVGALVFAAGAAINLQSDEILRKLRAPGEHGYRIPRGGFYRYVSSPNYLGEIVQWAGWALATWSGAGLAFLLLTIANLAPRARSNHQWYLEEFPDYPAERRALVPGLW